jgi:hypothetical protein
MRRVVSALFFRLHASKEEPEQWLTERKDSQKSRFSAEGFGFLRPPPGWLRSARSLAAGIGSSASTGSSQPHHAPSPTAIFLIGSFGLIDLGVGLVSQFVLVHL